MIVQLTSSPLGLSGQRSAFSLIFLLAHAPQRRRLADVFGARAALRLEAHRVDAGLRFGRALHRHEHDPADAEIQLLADALRRHLVIGRDLVHLDDQRMRELLRRVLVERAVGRHAFHEIRERRQRPLHAAFHRPVEDEIGVGVGHRICRELRRGLRRRRIGRRRGWSSRATGPDPGTPPNRRLLGA